MTDSPADASTGTTPGFTDAYREDRPTRSGPARVVRVIGRRWPTLLAIACGALVWGIDVVTATGILPILPLIYVVLTLVRRRSASWIVLIGVGALGPLSQLQTLVDPTLLLVILIGAVGIAALSRPGHGRLEAGIQLAGASLFAAISLVAPGTPLQIATILVASAYIGHAVWDVIHLRRRAVVSASYAEWCAVFDLILGAHLLILLG